MAAPFLADVSHEEQRASFAVVLSRRDFHQGDVRSAMARAEKAVEIDHASDVALANLASVSLNVGDAVASLAAAKRLVELSSDPALLAIGRLLIDLIGTSLDADVAALIQPLGSLASNQRVAGQTHFEGITYLNLAEALRATGLSDEALKAALTAEDLLESSSGAAEAATARAIAAWAEVHGGDQDLGWSRLGGAIASTNAAIRADALVEAAELEAFYGDALRARDYLSESQGLAEAGPTHRAGAVPVSAYLSIRATDYDGARAVLDSSPLGTPTGRIGHNSEALAVRAHLDVAADSPQAPQSVMAAKTHAQAQSASRWTAYCEALEAVVLGPEAMNRFIRLSIVATRGHSHMSQNFSQADLRSLGIANCRPFEMRPRGERDAGALLYDRLLTRVDLRLFTPPECWNRSASTRMSSG